MKKFMWRQQCYLCGMYTLLVLGGTLIFYPYYPAVQYSVRTATQSGPLKAVLPKLSVKTVTATQDELAGGNWLIIPAINVKAQIREGNDLEVLDRQDGVWHQTGSEDSNLVMAGHRFKHLPPNTQTFYNLDKLREGDEILVYTEGAKRLYAVQESFQVKGNNVGILEPTQTPQLTLYTCIDFSYEKRLVITARPI